MFVDTCTMGEMKIALVAGVPGRRLVLHGNNKSDEEIALAIEQGFAKIVIDEPDEPERVAAIARKLGKRARVMLRVTVGVHAGGHEDVYKRQFLYSGMDGPVQPAAMWRASVTTSPTTAEAVGAPPAPRP